LQAKEINDIIATVPEQTIKDIKEVQDNVKSKSILILLHRAHRCADSD
jgi:hypothetical protein